MHKVEIILQAPDGKEHARGLVDIDKVMTVHLVERNERLYYYKPTVGIGNYIFEECPPQRYIITEF